MFDLQYTSKFILVSYPTRVYWVFQTEYFIGLYWGPDTSKRSPGDPLIPCQFDMTHFTQPLTCMPPPRGRGGSIDVPVFDIFAALLYKSVLFMPALLNSSSGCVSSHPPRNTNLFRVPSLSLGLRNNTLEGEKNQKKNGVHLLTISHETQLC